MMKQQNEALLKYVKQDLIYFPVMFVLPLE